MLLRTFWNTARCFAALSSIVALAAPAYSQQRPAPQRQDQRPNILLVIMDDVGFDVTTDMYPGLIDGLEKQYGPSGLKNPKADAIKGRPASTPNLDQLARKGMVFSNAWAEPFCSPTRAAILTGLYAVKANVLTYADP